MDSQPCQICHDAPGIFVLEGYRINNWPAKNREGQYEYGVSWPRGTSEDHYLCNDCRSATQVIAL